MNGPVHILICGDIGVGKSTLIGKLLMQNKRPVSGFVTKKTPADENGDSRVYIHPASAGARRHTCDNLIGICGASRCSIYPEVFDTVGVKLLEAPPRGILLMDELGFMESGAPVFCEKVLRAFDGNVPILAAVKNRETPFLQAVKTHPNARLYWITRENRDALYTELIPAVMAWNQSER